MGAAAVWGMRQLEHAGELNMPCSSPAALAVITPSVCGEQQWDLTFASCLFECQYTTATSASLVA